MSSFKKILVVAGLLGASLFGAGASQAQAGGFGYGYGYRSFHYAPVYRPVIVTPYVAPVYNHCLPTYGYGFGY